MNNGLYKKNKKITKWLETQKPSEQQKTKLEAQIDNATPGPGLRRGGERRHSDSGRRRSKEQEEEANLSKGWGGFDLLKPVAETPCKLSSHQVRPLELISAVQDAAAAEGGDPTPEVPVKESAEPADETLTLAEKLNEFERIASELGVKEPIARPSDMTPAARSFPETYFFHATQAVVLAAAGGLNNALRSAPDSAEGGTASSAPKEIGRSLFFSLKLTTWEEDENVVLEVGWAATWWQEKPKGDGDEKAMQDRKEKEVEAKVAEGNKGDEEGDFEEISDQGHFM